jgi:hypothetical protein
MSKEPHEPHGFRAVNDDGSTRPIIGYGTWTVWECPAAWTADRLAVLFHCPAVYMVRAVGLDETPVQFDSKLDDGGDVANNDDLRKRTERWQGIVYIGKTVNLKERFRLLCRSWNDSPPANPHTSRHNWNRLSEKERQAYPADRMQVRHLCIGTQNWTNEPKLIEFLRLASAEAPKALNLAASPDDILAVLKDSFWHDFAHWLKGHGSDEHDSTVVAALSNERSLLCAFRQAFGRFPLLNRDVPCCAETDVDETWLEEYFAD